MDKLNKEIKRKLNKRRLFYVCRDVERAAAGLLLSLPNYFIITNDSPYARVLQKQYQKNIILVKSKEQLDTRELLSRCHSRAGGNPDAHHTRLDPRFRGDDTLTIRPNDLVLVFKPTKQIEQICQANKWKLLNPSAELANKVEEKILQVEWLGPFKKYLPGYRIELIKNIRWTGQEFILQFAHSHTGSGTMLIKSQKQLDELNKKFPERPTRVAKFIQGPLFTNNNVVWGNQILIGNINYQITGLAPFTDREFATIGNDWFLPHKILTKSQITQYKKIATDVGKKLASDGWKGLYGIDVVMDELTKKLYLLEINARQPASTTFESELQQIEALKQKNHATLTTFEAHLAALLGIRFRTDKLIEIYDGAQIIKRVGTKKISEPKNAWRVIRYSNTAPDADETRFQFLHGIMSGHNKIKI